MEMAAGLDILSGKAQLIRRTYMKSPRDFACVHACPGGAGGHFLSWNVLKR